MTETPNIVKVLTDLVFYEHSELVDASLSLLFQTNSQATNLLKQGQKVQLLEKESMIDRYFTFDDLLLRLGKLSVNRRLFNEEPYTAAWLMGQLTMHCYEEVEERSTAAKSAAKSVAMTARTKTDHTEGMYLLVLGKANVKPGSTTLVMTDYGLHKAVDAPEETRRVLPKDKLQIHGAIYSVTGVDGDQVFIDREIKLPDYMLPAASGGKPPLAKARSGSNAFATDDCMRGPLPTPAAPAAPATPATPADRAPRMLSGSRNTESAGHVFDPHCVNRRRRRGVGHARVPLHLV